MACVLRDYHTLCLKVRHPHCVRTIIQSKVCVCVSIYIYIYMYIYRVSREECARPRENVP